MQAAPRNPIPNAIFFKLKQFSSYNLLKRLSLRQIASSLPEGDARALRILFQQLKKDPRTRSLSVDELESAMVSKGENIERRELERVVRDRV